MPDQRKRPETKLGKRTGLAKTYEIPDTWYVKCILDGWIVAAGCTRACCTDHIGARMEVDKLIIDCQAI